MKLIDMKLALVLVALLSTALPAHSLEWLTGDAMSKLSNAPDGGFFLLNHDMSEPVRCDVVDWPISNPVGVMECSDGQDRTIQIKNDTTVIVDGYEYYRHL